MSSDLPNLSKTELPRTYAGGRWQVLSEKVNVPGSLPCHIEHDIGRSTNRSLICHMYFWCKEKLLLCKWVRMLRGMRICQFTVILEMFEIILAFI